MNHQVKGGDVSPTPPSPTTDNQFIRGLQQAGDELGEEIYEPRGSFSAPAPQPISGGRPAAGRQNLQTLEEMLRLREEATRREISRLKKSLSELEADKQKSEAQLRTTEELLVTLQELKQKLKEAGGASAAGR